MHRMSQGVAARVPLKHVHPHVIMCLTVRCLCSRWPLPLSRVPLHLLWFLHLHPGHHPPCGRNRRVLNPCAPAEWGVFPRGDTQPSHRLWAQPARPLRLLRNLCSDLPEWIRRHRHGTVVLVRCGIRRLAYRKSAIFTTAHSGARRTSEPETNLSLSWRMFVASSVLFHSYKYEETRVRTKFRFVSKTEIKSRPGKRANQDSPWKTKLANSCWSQIWDPEARTSSRVW